MSLTVQKKLRADTKVDVACVSHSDGAYTHEIIIHHQHYIDPRDQDVHT